MPKRKDTPKRRTEVYAPEAEEVLNPRAGCIEGGGRRTRINCPRSPPGSHHVFHDEHTARNFNWAPDGFGMTPGWSSHLKSAQWPSKLAPEDLGIVQRRRRKGFNGFHVIQRGRRRSIVLLLPFLFPLVKAIRCRPCAFFAKASCLRMLF